MFHRIRSTRRFLALIAILGSASASGQPLQIKIESAWVRAVPPSVSDTAAFMRIKVFSDIVVHLTGATTDIAAMAMPMATTRKTVNSVEVLGMKSVDSIEIPPNGEVTLKPGGDHLMLMNLKSHPHPGDMVSVTLNFEPGHQKLTVQMPVKIDD